MDLSGNIRRTEHYHKFCIIEYCTVISGSYNWTNAASNKKDQENILVAKDSSLLVKDYLVIFNKLWATSTPEFQKRNYKSYVLLGLIERLTLPEIQVDVVWKRFYLIEAFRVFMDERVRIFDYHQEVLIVQYMLFNNTSVFILTLPDLLPYESLPLDYYFKLTTKEFVKAMRGSVLNKYFKKPY